MLEAIGRNAIRRHQALTMVLLCCLLVGGPTAAEASADRIVFLGPDSPVVFELNVTVDGKDYREWLTEFYWDVLDGDRDGSLTFDEFQSVRPEFLNEAARQAISGLLKANSPLSKSQFAESAPEQLASLFSIAAIPNAAAQSVRLIPKLDVDGSGSLSAEEFSQGVKTLAKFDLDDDETLSATELTPFRDPLNRGASLVAETASLPFVRLGPSPDDRSATSTCA